MGEQVNEERTVQHHNPYKQLPSFHLGTFMQATALVVCQGTGSQVQETPFVQTKAALVKLVLNAQVQPLTSPQDSPRRLLSRDDY